MIELALLLGVLLMPLPSVAAEHVLAWTYTTQPQDRSFVVERCTNQRSRCRMERLATVPTTTRRYTDHTVHRQRTYCYQVGARDAQQVYLWSNMVCSE